MTTEKLGEWIAQALADVDIGTVFIEGIYFGEHIVLRTLGHCALDTGIADSP